MKKKSAIPYRYTGPLDPVRDKLVTVPRNDSVEQVVQGLKNGEYWGIFGLKQVGKTTLLRQIRIKYRGAHHFYFNFQLSPRSEAQFYTSMTDTLLDAFSSDFDFQPDSRWDEFEPDFRFLKFLEQFSPKKKRGKSKIVLQFDEIEEIPFVKKFLNLWRKVFHEREDHEQLRKYAVIITGSAELIDLTRGRNSPFNIARYLYMEDLTPKESRQLITGPFEHLNLTIKDRAVEKLIGQTGGHAQMLQNAGSILAKKALDTGKSVDEADIDEVIHALLLHNDAVSTLEQDLESPDLQNLVKRILVNDPPKFHLYKKFSVAGAGCIVEGENQRCAIRNKIYERVIKDKLGITGGEINNYNSHQSAYLVTPLIDPDGIVTTRVNYPVFFQEDHADRYNIIEQIGSGGMGARVVRAADKVMQRLVALKLISGSWFGRFDDIGDFFTEAQTAGRLSHSNIVTVYDVGRIREDFFISMELIDGAALGTIILKENPFSLAEIYYIAKQVLNGLEYAHRNNVIHRDVKPKNIMVGRDGTIKIVDFGIAALRVFGKTGDTGIMKGTPAYMAPEQFYGEKTDHRTDIYSFGVTLFQVAASRLPYQGGSKDSFARGHLNEIVPPVTMYRTDLPLELEKVIVKCMAKEPVNRFQDIAGVIEAVERIHPGPVDERSVREVLRERLPMTLVEPASGTGNKLK